MDQTPIAPMNYPNPNQPPQQQATPGPPQQQPPPHMGNGMMRPMGGPPMNSFPMQSGMQPMGNQMNMGMNPMMSPGMGPPGQSGMMPTAQMQVCLSSYSTTMYLTVRVSNIGKVCNVICSSK